ncbi:MAG: hypothetical protein O7E57_12330 [Gammaproteobacteria bacterium]|nr:hypothetical protein [Gammaproteobacteria bacterium]
MDEAQLLERAQRYDRETRICEGYARHARSYVQLAVLGLVAVGLFGRENIQGWFLLALCAWTSTVVFGGLYQYFVFRYLENLGTRYDLLPIVKRARILNTWANKPIIFYVLALMSFYLAAFGLMLDIFRS